VLYINSEGLCDLVHMGMVDCTELLTVWRPDLCNTEQYMVMYHSSEEGLVFCFVFLSYAMMYL